jgi:hypothetical protein
MSFIPGNKVPHTKVQYLPRYREAKSRNYIFILVQYHHIVAIPGDTSRSYIVDPGTVFLAVRKSRTLELLAFDE